MKKFLAIFLTLCFVSLYAFHFAYAGTWDKCKLCHNGKLAPDEKTLKEKYQSTDQLIKAAQDSQNPMMNPYKDEKELKEAAKDLGLK